MTLPLTRPVGSAYRLRYTGPVGVSGAGVQQTWDLTALPINVRRAARFRESLLVFVQQLDVRVTVVSPVVEVLPASGDPTTLQLTLTSNDDAAVVDLDVLYLHTIEGLAAGSRVYFFTQYTSPSPTPAPPILLWGSNSVAATTVTRYLPPSYDSSLASLTPVQYRIPAPMTLRNMRVRHDSPAGNGSPIVYTIRKENVATALTVSLDSDVADASNLVDSVTFAAGELIDLEVTKAAGIGSSPTDILVSVEVVAP